jgi:hypothetical protein
MTSAELKAELFNARVREVRPPERDRSAIEGLLGSGGSVRCKVISKDISVHWWRAEAKPGDCCLCGRTISKPETETAGPAVNAEPAT